MTLILKTQDKIKYQNQPLQEVASEIRFFGEPIVEAKRHEFFEEIRDKYPLVFVPGAVPGTAPQLQHYRFEKEDSTAGIQLSISSLSYFQRDYEGAPAYKDELFRIIKIANSYFNFNRFSRVGWRYINAIPFVRENSLIPLSRFFNSPPGFFTIDSNEFNDVSFVASTKFEEFSILVRLDSGEGSETKDEILKFDIDVYRSLTEIGNISIDNVLELITRSHLIGRNFFESAITDAYRNYLKGDIYE